MTSGAWKCCISISRHPRGVVKARCGSVHTIRSGNDGIAPRIWYKFNDLTNIDHPLISKV